MLRNLGIRSKLLAVLAVPMLVLLLGAGWISAQAVGRANDAAQVRDIAGGAPRFSALVQALQAERRVSVGKLQGDDVLGSQLKAIRARINLPRMPTKWPSWPRSASRTCPPRPPRRSDFPHRAGRPHRPAQADRWWQGERQRRDRRLLLDHRRRHPGPGSHRGSPGRPSPRGPAARLLRVRLAAELADAGARPRPSGADRPPVVSAYTAVVAQENDALAGSGTTRPSSSAARWPAT